MAATRTYQGMSGYSASAAASSEEVRAGYWRKRMQLMLERLESEARRMLQLEADLSVFANDYYNAVGEVTERLTEMEQRLASVGNDYAFSDTPVTHPMPDILASREAVDLRKRELKTRYRTLAKEMHPDRAGVTSTSVTADRMHTLNDAYQRGDLAAMLKLEAEMLLAQVLDADFSDMQRVERALIELERAAETYAQGYRTLLNSPINELMLRAMSARLAGWDWMQAVVKKVERTIEEKERAMIAASIAQISQWRADTRQAAIA